MVVLVCDALTEYLMESEEFGDCPNRIVYLLMWHVICRELQSRSHEFEPETP